MHTHLKSKSPKLLFTSLHTSVMQGMNSSSHNERKHLRFLGMSNTLKYLA